MIYEVYKTLERPHTSKYGKLVQNLILINIIVNIFVSFSGMFFEFSGETKTLFLFIENTTVLLFIIEIISRYISIGCNIKYQGLKGRLLFTFTPFMIIDILSLIPYFITNIQGDILLLRLVRLLKFLRVKDTIKHLFSINTFATSPIYVQLFILFLLSSFFIAIFSFVYTSGERTSLMIFLDPPALAETTTNGELIFGIIELLIGLFIGGALISIVTELLTNISNDIRSGYYPYKDKNHIIIINHNTKLEYILKEFNYYYKDVEKLKDIVIFLPFVDNIDAFNKNLPKFSNLKIILLTGEVLNWNSYKRLNINFAEKILILRNNNSPIEYLDIKIPKFLLSHKEFINPNLEFLIESENSKKLNMVYEEIFDTNYKYLIVNHNSIIEKFLNRAIIEPDYFKIYINLLSFKDFEFYILDFQEISEEDIYFKDAYWGFIDGLLLGVIQNNQLILNPSNDLLLTKDTKLLTILKNRLEYSFHKDFRFDLNQKILTLKMPQLKTKRNIVIIGDYDDIETNQIIDFLTDESIENLKRIVLKDKNYLDEEFWNNEIIDNNYDMVILNLEDDYEFLLTIYLRNKYKFNKRFLNSLVNIIHNPVNSQLLLDSKLKHNVILSEKFVGEYIVQIIFNDIIIDIFDEITHSNGNEFYLLEKDNYNELFEMSYNTLKLNLFENRMIYFGIIKNDEFIIDAREINSAEKIVVLAEGN